jgi:hypothetical protein
MQQQTMKQQKLKQQQKLETTTEAGNHNRNGKQQQKLETTTENETTTEAGTNRRHAPLPTTGPSSKISSNRLRRLTGAVEMRLTKNINPEFEGYH